MLCNTVLHSKVTSYAIARSVAIAVLYDGLHSSIVICMSVNSSLFICSCVSCLVSCLVCLVCSAYVLCLPCGLVLVGLCLCLACVVCPCGLPCLSVLVLSVLGASLGSATGLQMNAASVSVRRYIDHLPSAALVVGLWLQCSKHKRMKRITTDCPQAQKLCYNAAMPLG